MGETATIDSTSGTYTMSENKIITTITA